MTDPQVAAKMLLLVAQIIVAGFAVIITLIACFKAGWCSKRSSFKDFLVTFKWLLLAILFNIMVK
jgi:hypothetical protein